jgi:hypothetical protein
MPHYIVLVKAAVLEEYLVESESEELAHEEYSLGIFLGSDDTSLEVEAVTARLAQPHEVT